MPRVRFKLTAFFYVLILIFPAAAPADTAASPNGETTAESFFNEKPDTRLVLSGLRYDTEEDLEESRRSLENALAFDPANPDYHFELSRVYGALYDESVKKGNAGDSVFLDRSQNELEQVLMIRPDDVPAHYNLGVVYKRRQRMERAREEFYRVLKLVPKGDSASPTEISAWMQIGATYEDQGFYEDAREIYMKARRIGGTRPEIEDALEDLREKQKTAGRRSDSVPLGDTWTRQYVSGADYTQFGADALRARSQGVGAGALLPIAAQMLFQQFMERRQNSANRRDA